MFSWPHSSGLSASPRCASTLSGDQQSGAAPPARFLSRAECQFHQEPADPLRTVPAKFFA